MGKSLVPDESQGEFETQTIAFVALIGDMHEEYPSKNIFPWKISPKNAAF